ncbi:MAG: transcriptional repressor [Acidobacteria bacterium]|nr:transcriptional repressor [Acidobacteriota bacterium]
MTRLASHKVMSLVQTQGLKMTPQRRVIVEYLQTTKNHPTADEVMTAVNRKFPMTSRATVYNTLNWLKENGMVKEVFEGGVVHFDPHTAAHHHFVCNKCGKVEDIDCSAINEIKLCSLPDHQKVETMEVTLRGLCAACQKKR